MRAILVGLVAVLVFIAADVSVVTPTPATSAANSSTTGACVAGWQEWKVPKSAFESTPYEVIMYGGRPQYIVGGSNDGVLVLRKQGGDWKHVARGSSGHRGFVGGVPYSKTRMLGVGYERVPELDFSPTVGRVVGNQLFGRTVPRPTADRSALADVTKAPGGNAWAVGTRLYKGQLKAFATRWNGSRWTHHHPASGSGAGLLGIQRTAKGHIWAVGWKESAPGRPRPYIVRRLPSGWKVFSGPDIGAGTAVLTDIDFRNSRDGYAVGYKVGPGSDRHTAIMFHWNGSAWKDVTLPWADGFSALPRSIALGDGGQIWIGGTQLANVNREVRGFVAGRKAGAWTISTLGVPKDVRSEITDVEVTLTGAIAVGTVTNTALVLRTCDTVGPASNKRKRSIKVSSIAARRSADATPHDEYTIAPASSSTSSAKSVPSISASQGFVVRDRTTKAGLNMTTSTYKGFAADLDGNGWKDVYFSRHAKKPPYLALNGPNGLRQVTTGAFSALDRHGCAAADIDKSGTKDILCAVGRARGKEVTRHEMSLDPSAGSGSLAKTGLGIADPLGRGRVVTFFKLDDDAYPDAFVGSLPTRDDSLPSMNRFYRNEGGTFVPAPGVGLDRSYGAVCAWSGDIEKDGDHDLAYCTAWRTPNGPAGVRLMRNQGGRLYDRTSKLGIKPIGDIDVAFADVTGDQKKDLIQLSKTRIRVSKWTGARYVKIWEARTSDAVALAAADASGDGRADIYVVRGTRKQQKSDLLLVSKSGGTRFASVRIPQTSKGAADDVFSLDWDKNGLADFVVLNGRGPKGPVKLLASYRN
jgi:hypothetical protein